MTKVSLIASSVRPKLYPSFFKSLESEAINYEVIFAGNNFPSDEYMPKIQHKFRYIETKNIKPAQCYEIARRHAKGEVIVWTADDAECVGGILTKAYKYWKVVGDKKLILSLPTKESGYGMPEGKLFDMNIHRFFGSKTGTPLMAPLGMISREYFDELGGIDRRYVCGQYENDVVMRALADGGGVKIFSYKDAYIDIDHLGKSYLIGESKTQNDFIKRPFALGYVKDREVLERSWVRNGVVSTQRTDTFEPYLDADILTESQSNRGVWV